MALILVLSTVGCENPFSPGHYTDPDSGGGVLSDLSTSDGIFVNLRYAYTFKDTTIYGNLLTPDFTFTYRDYDQGFDVTWGRDEEMRTTYGLFQNSQRLDLVWNNIVSISGDSTHIVRSFNLTITFNPTDIVYIDGKVNLELNKDTNNKWKIIHWIDESNF